MKRTRLKRASPKKKGVKACDNVWKKIVKVMGHCEMCGRSDLRLNAHHLIRRDSMFFRHNPENGICLCTNCHIFNTPPKISAHGTPIAFNDWLKERFPDRHEWLEKNRHKVKPNLKINYAEVYATLKEQDNG